MNSVALHILGLAFIVIAPLSEAVCQTDYDMELKRLYKNTITFISPTQLYDKMKKDDKFYLLDTRTPAEYRVSHISGAISIDYEHFKKEDVDGIPRDVQVIVYCSVGYRSERIGEKLLEMGFKDIKNMYGGIFQWKNEGFKVVNLHGHPTDSVHTYSAEWSRWLKNGIKTY